MSLLDKKAAAAAPNLVSQFKKVKAAKTAPNPTSKLPEVKAVKNPKTPQAPVEKLEPLHRPAKTTETEPVNPVKEELSAKSRFGWLTNPIRVKTAGSLPDASKILDTMSSMIREELIPQQTAESGVEVPASEPVPESPQS